MLKHKKFFLFPLKFKYLQDSFDHKAMIHGVSLQLCQVCGSDYTWKEKRKDWTEDHNNKSGCNYNTSL